MGAWGPERLWGCRRSWAAGRTSPCPAAAGDGVGARCEPSWEKQWRVLPSPATGPQGLLADKPGGPAPWVLEKQRFVRTVGVPMAVPSFQSLHPSGVWFVFRPPGTPFDSRASPRPARPHRPSWWPQPHHISGRHRGSLPGTAAPEAGRDWGGSVPHGRASGPQPAGPAGGSRATGPWG